MAILDILLNILRAIGNFILQLLSWLYEKFIALPLFEKGIIIAYIPAFFSVILPVAKHHLFGTINYVHNDLAVYLIGIVLVMYITHFYEGKIPFLIRVLLNAYYLFWMILIHFRDGIVKTDYTLTSSYFLNLVTPILFIVLSVLSYYDQR